MLLYKADDSQLILIQLATEFAFCIWFCLACTFKGSHLKVLKLSLSVSKLQFTAVTQGRSRDLHFTPVNPRHGWDQRRSLKIPGLLRTSRPDQGPHKASHSFVAFYEISEVKVSLRLGGGGSFPLHQGRARLCQMVPGRSTMAHITSEAGAYCQVSHRLLSLPYEASDWKNVTPWLHPECPVWATGSHIL